MTETCWSIGDPTAMLAALAQVFATLAALGGGFGVMQLQALQRRRQALADSFFAVYRELGIITGLGPNDDVIKSARAYVGPEQFFPDCDKVAEYAKSKLAGEFLRTVHALVAYKMVKAHLLAVPRDRSLTLWLTVVPVALNGVACAAAASALLVTTFNGMLAVRQPEAVGRAAAVVAVAVLTVTVGCAILLLLRAAHMPDLSKQKSGSRPGEFMRFRD
jgi:hypothetical protein